jgi:2-isopropylmalate synthase
MSPLAGFFPPIILPATDRSHPFDATYLQAPVTAMRYVEHHLFEHPAPSGKAHVQGIRIGVEVNGQPMLLTGMGNGPIDAAVHALQAVGIQVQERSYEEHPTRASTHAGDVQVCAFLELVSAAGGPKRFGVGMAPTSSPLRSRRYSVG